MNLNGSSRLSEPNIELLNHKEERKLIVGIDQVGNPVVCLSDQKGNDRIWLGYTMDGQGVAYAAEDEERKDMEST